jgi:transposase-like protein
MKQQTTTNNKRVRAWILYTETDMTVTEVCRALEISRVTMYRIIKTVQEKGVGAL